jgi:bacterial transferase hexapeptide domain protein
MKYDYIKEVNIYMPVAENYKDIWTFIQSDYYRMKGSLTVGNPARVIKENCSARYTGTPWLFSVS